MLAATAGDSSVCAKKDEAHLLHPDLGLPQALQQGHAGTAQLRRAPQVLLSLLQQRLQLLRLGTPCLQEVLCPPQPFPAQRQSLEADAAR